MFSSFQINESEVNCSLAETKITEIVPTCKDLIETIYEEIPASKDLVNSQTQPLDFAYKGSPSVYVDLNNTQIYVECELTHKDGTPIDPLDPVGPVNLLSGALFETAELYINETQVTIPGSMYAYRCYFESLLNFSDDAKENWMTQDMYYEDSPGSFNSVLKKDHPYNEGLTLRKEITDLKKFDMLFTPHLELFNQHRILLPCDIRLKFSRNPSEFYIMNKDETKQYKVRILNASLFLRTLKFTKDFEDKLDESLQTKVANYPLLRSEVTSFDISKGAKSFTYPMAKLGKAPIRVFLALISNDALNGEYFLNPFEFNSNKLTSISFSLKGKSYPSTALKMTWDDEDSGCYLRAYNELMRTTGVLNINDGWGIDRSAYPKGFFIIGQKLTESFTSDSFAPESQGTLSIRLTFAEPLPQLTSCILLLEYQNTISMSKNGQIGLDYVV